MQNEHESAIQHIIYELRKCLYGVFAVVFAQESIEKDGYELPAFEDSFRGFVDADTKIREIMLRATYECGEIRHNADGLRKFYLNVFREVVKVLEDAEVADKQDA